MPLQKRLVDYIYKYLSQSYTPRGIKSRLLKDGWGSAEIDAAISVAQQMVGSNQPIVPRNSRAGLGNFSRAEQEKAVAKKQAVSTLQKNNVAPKNAVQEIKAKPRLPDLGDDSDEKKNDKKVVDKKPAEKKDIKKSVKKNEKKEEIKPKIEISSEKDEKKISNKSENKNNVSSVKTEVKKKDVDVPKKLNTNQDKPDSSKNLGNNQVSQVNSAAQQNNQQTSNQQIIESEKKSLAWMWILLVILILAGAAVVYYLFFREAYPLSFLAD